MWCLGYKGTEIKYRYSSNLSLTSALDGCGWSTPRPGRFTPGNDPVPSVQEAGWAPGPVLTGAKNLAQNGIRSPDRPGRSESLYRIRHPDFDIYGIFNINAMLYVTYCPVVIFSNPKLVSYLR
jgi:hypothetical protein